jgi:hypothetical protein
VESCGSAFCQVPEQADIPYRHQRHGTCHYFCVPGDTSAGAAAVGVVWPGISRGSMLWRVSCMQQLTS